MEANMIALIPARGGSLRVPSKNIRILGGHPLIAYTVVAALQSGVFKRVILSTDSEEIRQIGLRYGAEAPFLRPKEMASSISLDIEWITHAFDQIGKQYDSFSILRPTSPFRSPATIQRAYKQFTDTEGIDSLRAVELCRQHPGKMWTLEGNLMRPFINQDDMERPYHACQYQDLPQVYIQNSSLEMAWSRVVWEHRSREGRVVAPFITEGYEGFSIDYEEDFMLAELLVETQKAILPKIKTGLL